MRTFVKPEVPISMLFLRTALVHKLSRFLMIAMLFTVLGTSLDNVYALGHGGDFQTAAVMVCDEPSDSSDFDLFPASDSAGPAFSRPAGGRPSYPATLPVQAFYSPPPRPPAHA